MSGNDFAVRLWRGSVGQFEVADVSISQARQRAQQFSQLSKDRAYAVVNVHAPERALAVFINGKEV